MKDAESTNSRVVLDIVLNQRRKEIYPDSSPEYFFELFTAEQILKDYDLSHDELESGLVGGRGDGGVDGIYLFVNGDLVQEDTNYSGYKKNIIIDLIVFQSKTHAGFQETPIERLTTVSTDLFNLSGEDLPANAYNECSAEAIRRFRNCYVKLAVRFPALNVYFYYASKGTNPTDSVKRKISELERKITSAIPQVKFNFQFLGASELYDLAYRQPHTPHELQVAEMLISPGAQVGFVCLVNLPDFFNFIVDEKKALQKQLFEANVRDYQGTVKVNRAIRASLSKATEDFWWLNNGVSILATDISVGGKTLNIQDPQIVNGLQTSKEIYNYCKEAKTDNESRKILVRIMVPKEEESRDNIIRATNSQTSVPPASLRSTDRIHRNIEEYLKTKGLFYDRRKNYYKNEGKPRNKIIGIPHLAQAVMAIALRQPDQARARPSTLLNDNKNYQRVFNLRYPLDLYYVCVEGMRKIESCLKSPSLGVEPKYRNDLRFYVAMHAIAGVDGKPPEPDEIVKFDVSSLNEETVKLSLQFIMPKYIDLGGDARASRSPELLKAVLGKQ